MFRILAALAIAVSIDIYMFNGKYTAALWQIAMLIRHTV